MTALQRLRSALARPTSERGRRFLRRALFLCALLVTLPTWVTGEAVGQAHVMRGGTVRIQSETERELFFGLICMCGCPRETLGTCACEYGGERREELRGMLAQGLSIEAIQKAYADRFGTHAVALPPNSGASRLIWALPLLGIIAGAFLVVRLLRKWSIRGREVAASEPAVGTKRDAYDDRLDDELKDLDRE